MTNLGFSWRRWLGHRVAAIAFCSPFLVLALALATGAGCAAQSGNPGSGGSGVTSSHAATGSGGAPGTGGMAGTGGTAGVTGTGGMTTTASSASTSGTTTTASSASSAAGATGTGGMTGTGGAGGAGGSGPVYMPPPGTPDYPAEMEPNNLVSMANPLQAGTKGFTAAIYPLGDIDNFAFTITVPGSNVTVATSDGMGGCPVGAQTLVRILDSSDNVLASDDGSNGCASFNITNTPALLGLPLGTYYVHVESAALAPILFYILDIHVQAPTCGDAIVEVGIGEQCDHGSSNGSPTDGCSATCQITSGNYLDEIEPNDTQATGNDLDGHAGAVGQLEPSGDVDWYTVSVTVAGSSITAEIGDGFGGCPGGFDSILSLVSPSKVVLASDQGGGVTPCSKIAPAKYTAASNLPVGTYGIEVQSASQSAQPFYVLKVTVAAPGCGDGIVQPPEQCDPGPTPVPGCSATCMLTGDFIPETEPNDTQATANPLGTHAGFVGAISPAGDYDYFSFTVPGPNSLVFIQTSDGLGGCPPNFDSVIRLYNPAGMQIALDDNGGVGLCSLISPVDYPTQTENLPGGTYKVRVEFSGDNSVAPLYVLTIRTAQPGCGDGILEAGEQCDDGASNGTAGDGCSATCQSLPPWEIEPNNSIATATPQWPGYSTWKGSISPIGDHDYYSFVMAAAGNVTLTTHDVDMPTYCSSDTVLYLVNSANSQLAFDDDSGPGPGDPSSGRCSLINTPLAAGTYYAWVERYNDSKIIPAYQLDLLIQ